MRTVFGRTQIDSILRKTFCKITTPLEVTRFELCDGKTREIPLFWPRIEIPGRWIQRAAVVAFVHERFIHFSNVEERQRILGPGFLSVALTTIMYSLYLSSALYKSILGSFSSRYTHVEVSGSRRNMWKKNTGEIYVKKTTFPRLEWYPDCTRCTRFFLVIIIRERWYFSTWKERQRGDRSSFRTKYNRIQYNKKLGCDKITNIW